MAITTESRGETRVIVRVNDRGEVFDSTGERLNPAPVPPYAETFDAVAGWGAVVGAGALVVAGVLTLAAVFGPAPPGYLVSVALAVAAVAGTVALGAFVGGWAYLRTWRVEVRPSAGAPVTGRTADGRRVTLDADGRLHISRPHAVTSAAPAGRPVTASLADAPNP